MVGVNLPAHKDCETFTEVTTGKTVVLPRGLQQVGQSYTMNYIIQKLLMAMH